MISSNLSECPKCLGPLVEKQAHGYPILSQIVFGVSFVVFMVFFDQLKSTPAILWAWTAFQIGVAILLIRGRLRTKKRVLHCIRCDSTIG